METENTRTNGKETMEKEEPVELVLFQVPECYAYSIPQRKPAASYRADEWDLNKWAWEGVLKVISKGDDYVIRLEDKSTGELYARAFFRKGEPHPVEAVTDSNRYFVLQIEENLGDHLQHAFIGIGFRERTEASDFQAVLTKIGKNTRKRPLHQTNFVNNSGGNTIGNSPARQQPQPQVYKISKNDFRHVVQQLTGSPSQQDPLPRPPSNPPKNPSMRLQRIRPPPLTPINRPPMPPVVVAPAPMQPRPQGQHMAPPQVPYNNGFARPPPHFGQLSPRGMQVPQFGQPSPRGMQPPQPFPPGDAAWTTPAMSPISAYMQQLQNCIGDGGPWPGQQQWQPQISGQVQAQPQIQHHVPGHFQAQQYMQPYMQPQVSGQVHAQHPVHPQVAPLPSPGTNGPGLLPNPNVAPLPSPGTNGPGLLPSPNFQLMPPSPSFFNFPSPTPWSPYPLLSPGSQFPPPLSPNFAFSSMGQTGILGPGPQPPLSPGMFPPSPSGLFPMSSPIWRDQ